MKTILKEKLRNGELTIGSWITIGSSAIAEIFANSGFDWLVVDLEHTTLSLDQAGEIIRTIDLSGLPALVRLTDNDSNQIKRVMDAGANGIVVPMVNSIDDAKSAISATRYAPIGHRGVGLARAQLYGDSFRGHLEWQKDGPVVIVQIEHQSALDNLTEKKIQSSIKRLMKNKTSLIIAHRLSTIEDSDLIYVLEKGKILESGKHEELLKKCKLYANLQLREELTL